MSIASRIAKMKPGTMIKGRTLNNQTFNGFIVEKTDTLLSIGHIVAGVKTFEISQISSIQILNTVSCGCRSK